MPTIADNDERWGQAFAGRLGIRFRTGKRLVIRFVGDAMWMIDWFLTHVRVRVRGSLFTAVRKLFPCFWNQKMN